MSIHQIWVKINTKIVAKNLIKLHLNLLKHKFLKFRFILCKTILSFVKKPTKSVFLVFLFCLHYYSKS